MKKKVVLCLFIYSRCNRCSFVWPNDTCWVARKLKFLNFDMLALGKTVSRCMKEVWKFSKQWKKLRRLNHYSEVSIGYQISTFKHIRYRFIFWLEVLTVLYVILQHMFKISSGYKNFNRFNFQIHQKIFPYFYVNCTARCQYDIYDAFITSISFKVIAITL